VICPSCGHENIPGLDHCEACNSDLAQEGLLSPEESGRWRVLDPISSLDPSLVEPQVVLVGTSLADGIARMQTRNVGYLLVANESGSLVGILTEHDILCRVAGQITDLEEHTVDQFMVRRPTALQAADPIRHALYFMALNDFMYIPVVDEQGRPQDLLSFRRVARLIDQID
jgi:CBS domain-containing protein